MKTPLPKGTHLATKAKAMPKYLTTGEAAALNLAAKHGSKVRDSLGGFFRRSRKSYVKNVGYILINEKAEAGNRYFKAADRLTKQAAIKEPIKIIRGSGKKDTRVARRAMVSRRNGAIRTGPIGRTFAVKFA